MTFLFIFATALLAKDRGFEIVGIGFDEKQGRGPSVHQETSHTMDQSLGVPKKWRFEGDGNVWRQCDSDRVSTG